MALIEPQPLSPAADGATLRSEPFVPGTSVGRYRIIALAGSGAMGDVYRAHDRALGRDVALKVLPPDLVNDRDRVRRFAHEARAASALSHPHIVTIYEVGHARPSFKVQPIAGGRVARRHEVHYIAMEYIDGPTLREAEASLTLRRRIEVMAQVADGLTKAHGAGIIHRDLKPDNILIAREGYAKIVDFGLAKLVDSDGITRIGADSPTLALTQKGEILGTPAYMSPEQVKAGTIDQRSDIFSFGCILYELLGGHQPFEGESFVDTLHTIIHDLPPPLPAAVPEELARVIERCLRKDPAQRYASIAEAARDLRRWLQGAEVLPFRATPARRQRASRAVIATVVAAVIVIVAAVGAAVVHRYSPSSARPEQQSIRRLTSSGRVQLAAIAPDGRYVAYVTSEPLGRSLWIEQVETHSRLQLTPPGDAYYAGLAFSRDGNYVYFARYDSYPFGALYRVPMLGGKAEIIVHDVDSRPAFSPDGARIAYVRDDYNRGVSTLFVANAGGSGERSLSVSRIPHRLYSPAWSPDGTRIVAVDGAKLADIAFPSGQRRDVATQVRFQRFNGVTWTPDGALVASAAREDAGDHLRLWRIDPASGECRPITDELSNVFAPSSTADGSTVAVLQLVRQANLFTVDDGGMRQLTTGVGASADLRGVAWAGDRILYSSSTDGNPDLWSLDPRGGEASRLTTAPASDVEPTAVPDGSLVVYRSGNGTQWSLWCMRPDGSERRPLTGGGNDGAFAVSPDSKTLAWATLEERSSEWVLWTMPLSGGRRSRLTSRRSLLEHIRFTPDGQSILFTGYENTRSGIFRIAATGGPVTALTTKRAVDASVSPDGRTIACAYGVDDREETSLGLLSAADPSRVQTFAVRGWRFRWRDSRSISFLDNGNGASNLCLQPLAGGPPRKLTTFSDGSIADYAWSNDGKRAVVAHVVDSVDVMLIRR